MNNKKVNVFGKEINVCFGKVDRFISEIMENNEYKRLFDNITVVDIGANIGAFSLWIYPFAGKIYAIEPTDCVNLLKETKKKNNLDKLEVFECAIAAGTGKRRMKGETSPDGSGGEWSFEIGGGNFTKEVQTYSLREFMDLNKIDYIDVLKIDTEGAEFEILNAGDFPKSKVHTIIGETHNDHGRVMDKLKELGFTILTDDSRFIAKRL